ncbi:MAG TPA: hypothetical protein ACFCUC_03325 [Desulfobacterales bacterium]
MSWTLCVFLTNWKCSESSWSCKTKNCAWPTGSWKNPAPEEVRQVVNEVLTNPRYRENAKRILADFAKYDALTRTCELLESLV